MSVSERVLFIDDDAPVRAAFARALRASGIEVDLADGAAAAHKLIAERPYAVIAVDYRMPETNGLDLISDLQSRQAQATFVVVSGECDLDLALEAVNNRQVANVLSKPWDNEELRAVIRRGISSHFERVAQVEVQRHALNASRALEEQKRRLEEVSEAAAAQMADLLVNAVTSRGHETRAHCRRVAAYARLIAEAMGQQGQFMRALEHGALLHDVGQIGIPDALLNKTGALSEDEWKVLREHPALGAHLLDGIELLRGARDIVLHHHERFDGTGYPFGLVGEEISLGGRILAVADTLEAMLTPRPHKAGEPLEAALRDINEASGKLFDPRVVDALLRVPVRALKDVAFADPHLTVAQAAA